MKFVPAASFSRAAKRQLGDNYACDLSYGKPDWGKVPRLFVDLPPQETITTYGVGIFRHQGLYAADYPWLFDEFQWECFGIFLGNPDRWGWRPTIPGAIRFLYDYVLEEKRLHDLPETDMVQTEKCKRCGLRLRTRSMLRGGLSDYCVRHGRTGKSFFYLAEC